MNRASEFQNQDVTAAASHTVGVVDHVKKYNLFSKKEHSWARMKDSMLNTGLASSVTGAAAFTAAVTGVTAVGATMAVPLMATGLACFAASKIAEKQSLKNFQQKVGLHVDRDQSHGDEGIAYETEAKNNKWVTTATAPPKPPKQ